MYKHFFTKQFVLFLGVGITSAAVNWISRWTINHWLDFSMAVIFAYFFGMTCAYILNRLFVFKTVNRSMLDQIRNFILVNLAMLPVVTLGAILFNKLLLLVGFTLHAEDMAHGLALGLPVVITFLIYKFYTFRNV